MDLSFNDLKRRDVVNVRDGKCLGNIVDLVLKFPEGSLQGVVVPVNKGNFITKWFNKQTLFIPERQILKIGGDVIFVDLRCGDLCDGGAVGVGKKARPPKPDGCRQPCPPNFQSCPPNCPHGQPNRPNYPPIEPRGEDFLEGGNIFDAVREDYGDY